MVHLAIYCLWFFGSLLTLAGCSLMPAPRGFAASSFGSLMVALMIHVWTATWLPREAHLGTAIALCLLGVSLGLAVAGVATLRRGHYGRRHMRGPGVV